MPKEKSPMKINKTTIVIIILIVWAAFSVVYMINDYWNEFKLGRMQAAFQNGSSQTIAQIIEQAKTCQQPVNLYSGDTQVNLVAVECLQQANQEQGGEEMMMEEGEE